jgi:hypothetical protein
MSQKRLKQAVGFVLAMAFGLWGTDLVPGWVMMPLLVVGGVLLVVECARWLDRNAY